MSGTPSDEELCANLNEFQQQTLHEFRGITAFADGDLEKVIKLLKITHWELLGAIAKYFDEDWKQLIIDHEQQQQQQQQRAEEPPEPAIPARPLSLRDMMDQNRVLLPDYASFRPRLPVVKRLDDNYRSFLRPGLPVQFNRKTGTFSYGSSGLAESAVQSSTGFFLNRLSLILLFIPQTLFSLGWKLLNFVWTLICYGIGLRNESVVDHTLPATSGGKNQTKSGKYVNKRPIGDFMCRTADDPQFFSALKTTYADDASMLEKIEKLKFMSFNEVYDDCRDNYKFMVLIMLGGVLDSVEQVSEKNDTGLSTHSSSSSLLNEKEDVTVREKHAVTKNDSTTFLENVFLSEPIVNFFQQNREEYNFYICDVENQFEGWKISRDLKIKQTPSIYVIANVTNSNYPSPTGMSVLGGFVRFEKPGLMLRCLEQFASKFNNELISSRTDKKEIELTRFLKEQQDLQYQESLQMDKDKNDKKLVDNFQKIYVLHKCSELLTGKGQAVENGDIKKDCTIQVRTSTGTRFLLSYYGDKSYLSDVYEELSLYLYLGIENGNDIKRLSVLREKITDRVEQVLNDDSNLLFKDESIEELDEETIETLIEEEYHRFDDQFGLSNSKKQEIVTHLRDNYDFTLVTTFPKKTIPNDNSILLESNADIYPKGNLLLEFQ